jgi:ATP-dependent DNA helicase RecG
MALHINLEELLSARTVESDRIEFKEGWNPDAVYRSICAFANDFDNTGGGYILIGVKENPLNKIAARPVKGLTTKEIGEIQKAMIGFNNLMRPDYTPKLFIEEVDGCHIIVLWVIAGSERPYEVPETITARTKTWKYFIRKYASSVVAKGIDKNELISLTNNIPFDDRANSQTTPDSISMFLVQQHLRKIESKLADEIGVKTNNNILQQMELLTGSIEQLFPRNVALMLFAEKPHNFFPYSWVEIIHFPKGTEDKEFIEKKIEGPIQQQITNTLAWLKSNILQEKVTKIFGKEEAVRVWNYPYAALEEAVANCLFHRNYQQREPVTIRIEPNAMLLYNSGGPDRSIKREDFATGRVIPRRYRNRRLGDFLKELKLSEGHATGLPALKKAMHLNGSPEPLFDFDEERTWFQVTFPIHSSFEKKIPFIIDLATVTWNVHGIDSLLNQLLEFYGMNDYGNIARDEGIAGGIEKLSKTIDNQTIDALNDIASGIAGAKGNAVVNSVLSIDSQVIRKFETIDDAIVNAIAIYIQHVDNLTIEIIDNLDSAIVSAIAQATVEVITIHDQTLLKICLNAVNRKKLLKSINLVNHRKNYNKNVKPLADINWLTMTIPNKPTSPKQKYLTTLKGRLILEFLKHIPN